VYELKNSIDHVSRQTSHARDNYFAEPRIRQSLSQEDSMSEAMSVASMQFEAPGPSSHGHSSGTHHSGEQPPIRSHYSSRHSASPSSEESMGGLVQRNNQLSAQLGPGSPQQRSPAPSSYHGSGVYTSGSSYGGAVYTSRSRSSSMNASLGHEGAPASERGSVGHSTQSGGRRSGQQHNQPEAGPSRLPPQQRTTGEQSRRETPLPQRPDKGKGRRRF
jgi:hypothetical protein